MSLSFRSARTALFVLLALAVLFVAGRYARLRWWTNNFHVVVEGEVYRSAQPSLEQVAGWAHDPGLRTLINLRDDAGETLNREERRAAEAAGIELLHFPLSDRHLPERVDFLRLMDALEVAERPLLIHCRAGADRTGVLSVLASMAIGGAPYDQARGQLSLRTLHLKSEADAVEGVLAKYESHCRREGTGTGGWPEFRRWLSEHYSHAYYLVEIEAPSRIWCYAGGTVRLDVVVRNRTDTEIPAGAPGRAFSLASYTGSSVDMVPDREYKPRTPLTEPIPPFAERVVQTRFRAPDEPGVHALRFDLIEETVTWFATEGSPENEQEMVVLRPGTQLLAALGALAAR